MTDLRENMLRDKELIKSITNGADLDNPDDIEKIYRDLQSGAYTFESEVGRNFDDKIYELHEKVLSGEITSDPVSSGSKGRSKEKSTNGKNRYRSDGSKKSVEKRLEKHDAKYEKVINELALEELKKKEKRRKSLILLAALVAVFSLGYFAIYNYMSTRTDVDYNELASLKGSRSLASKNSEEPIKVNKTSIETPDILPEYQTLYAKNVRLSGWLKIDDTKIDYPVMQTTDNDYYLNHNFNQQKDNNGSLFLDCACSLYPKSTNMIIYGHHMKSGNMFGNLQKYAKEDYGKKHSTIKFDTIYEKGTYEVMYVFYSKVYDNDELVFKYYQFINANSEKEFDYYMSEMEKLSLYNTGVSAHYGDTLLTLSTCDHSQTDGRFAVVAKRVG
ncbi:MAG: class B sortase [Lachnospiraceae bacterium]|nr:class B sortase [Lachnospiraceae bacterium]